MLCLFYFFVKLLLIGEVLKVKLYVKIKDKKRKKKVMNTSILLKAISLVP